MNASGASAVLDEYLHALLDETASPVEDTPALRGDHTAVVAAPPPVAAQPPVAKPAASTPSPGIPQTPQLPVSPRWLRVSVGTDSYALELMRVQEVVRLAPIVAMRGTARAVLGVMNLRGRILPVFDLGLWLGSQQVQSDERNRIVVVERDNALIGVLVSAVENVVALGDAGIEPPLAGSEPGAILGIARVGSAPTVLLDAEALFGSVQAQVAPQRAVK